MNYKIVARKAGCGFLLFVVAYLCSHPQLVVNMIPDDIRNMTVGAFVTFFLAGLGNWLKHRKRC